MDLSRRQALQKLATGTAAVAATAGFTTIALPGMAHASEVAAAPKNAVSMLYDTTRCIGCQSCVAACAEANSLQPDTRLGAGLHLAPPDLNSFTKNIIKLYKPNDNISNEVGRSTPFLVGVFAFPAHTTTSAPRHS